MKVTGLPAVGCGEESGHFYCEGGTMCPENQSVANYLSGTPKSKYRIMQSGTNYSIQVALDGTGGLAVLQPLEIQGTPTLRYIRNGSSANPEATNSTPAILSDNQILKQYSFPVQPTLGSDDDYLEIAFSYFVYGDNFYRPVRLLIPVLSQGVTDAYTEVLGRVIQPQIPYMILHDPPGDGSFSAFEANKTFCRSVEKSYVSGQSNSANLDITLGTSGALGIAVMVDYELSATFSAGFTISESVSSTGSREICLSTTQGFMTSALASDLGDGSDLFLGYGTDLDYGIYESIGFDAGTCNAVTRKGLAFAPVGEPREFALTTQGIQAQIEQLETVANGAGTPKDQDLAKIQLQIWNQVLTLNQNNVSQTDDLIKSLAFNFFSVSLFLENGVIWIVLNIDSEATRLERPIPPSKIQLIPVQTME